MREPKVGEIVYFFKSIQVTERDKEPIPAMVTSDMNHVKGSAEKFVGLTIFNINGIAHGAYPYSRTPKPGYWTYRPD